MEEKTQKQVQEFREEIWKADYTLRFYEISVRFITRKFNRKSQWEIHTLAPTSDYVTLCITLNKAITLPNHDTLRHVTAF